VSKRIKRCLMYPCLVSHAPLVLFWGFLVSVGSCLALCLLASFVCAALGFVMPSSVSLSLVLLSCLGLLCSCAAALSGAPLFPLFLALFFFVGVLAWVVVSSL